MATTTATQIQQLYVGLLGRAADQGGLNWWADQVTTGGKTLEDVRASFVTSTEYTTTYGAAATRADLVTSIYQNLFERTPSADEVKYWAETDTRPADQLVAAFIEFAGAADQAVINNKTFVAQTYTDTVGTGFSAEGAAAVIADVDGTSASVAAALETINSGTLPGQVPALALINAAAAADVAVVNFEEANKAAVDALVTKLEADDGDNFNADLNNAALAADGVRAELTVTVDGKDYDADGTDTRLLKTQGDIFDESEATALAALDANQKALAAGYKSALTAEATAKEGQATDAEEAAVVAGLQTDTTAAAGLAKLGTPATAGTPAVYDTDGVTVIIPAVPPTLAESATAQQVFDRYEAGTPDQRAVIEDALKGSAYYSTFKAVAVKEAAYADAQKATQAAEDKLTATDTAPSTKAADYLDALVNKTDYSAFLAKVVAADADIASVKAITDAYAVQTEAAGAAHDAVDNFTAVNVHIADVSAGANTAGTGAAVKDVFYFADKLTATSATPDFKIDSFAAGDSIVLGNGYSFNNGALSTGDNNKLEFFLVKSDAGVQIVLEGAKYGSDQLSADATTGVIASTSGDHAQVITLTGVTAEHVSVANGVVSYV